MKKLLFQLGRLMSVRVLAIGLTFVQTIVFTRVFGSEVFGLLSFALSISAILLLVLSFGLDQVLMRDIARVGLRGVRDTMRWIRTWQLVWRLVLPATLGLSIVGAVIVALTSWGGAYSIALLATFIALPIVMARKYAESIALGTKQVLRSLYGSQIAYPILMVLGALGVWTFSFSISDSSISWIYVGASLGSLLISVVLIWPTLSTLRVGKNQENTVEEGSSARVLLTSGGHFAMVSIGFVLGQHIDVLLTGLLAGPEDVALVRIASRVAEMAGLMRAIILLQYKPMLAEAYGKADMALLQEHASVMLKVFVVTGVPITLGLLVFANETMSVFGPEFTDGAWAMRIYVIGVVFLLFCGPCNSILAMCDNEKAASLIVWGALIINILLDLILIPHYGAIGAACANMISMLVIGVFSSAVTFRRLGIRTTIIGVFLNRKQ